MVDIIGYIVIFLGLMFLAISFLYIKFGILKKFFHDILGWHQPAIERGECEIAFDGANIHTTCKHCGKEIMQDSQGNWF